MSLRWLFLTKRLWGHVLIRRNKPVCKRLALCAASIFALLSTEQLAAQSPAPAAVTLIKAGRLLDPRTGNLLSPAAVLIEGGKIKQVGSPSQVSAPNGTRVI